MFRGKESSNRIELSRLVQDLLNFGVLGSLRLWGWGGGWMGWGVVGDAPTHMHMCAHGKHDNFMQMAASIGFLGNPWEFPMMSYTCVCVCVHACMCICVHMCRGHPLTTPTHIHRPPQGGTPGISQNSIVLELIEIFQFRLKI